MHNMVLSKPKYIKKHNAAIRSYSDMTLLQRKLANTLLYNAYNELENKDFHEISISRLLLLLCMKTHDYEKLKRSILKLMSTRMEWNVVKKVEQKNSREVSQTEDSWKACAMLSSVEITGTTIKYEYSRMLRDQLYNPSFYSKVNLNIQNKLRSLYSLALYENSLSYVNCGSSGWISFEMFRKLMGVNDSQYKVFRDFNKRVLKPAIKEVNESSEIEINYEVRRENRVPTHIRLIITKKQIGYNDVSNILENTIPTDDSLQVKLQRIGFSKNDCQDIFEKYGRDSVLEKLELIESSKSKIISPVAFMKTALRDNYKKNNVITKHSSVEYAKTKQDEEAKSSLKTNYKNYIDESYRTWLSNLADGEKMVLVRHLMLYCESSNIPTCKRAKLKLNNDNLLNDKDVFFSVKTFVISQKNESAVGLSLPELLSIEDFSVSNFTSEHGSEVNRKS